MERTLEIMLDELKSAEQERKPIYEALERASKKVRKLEDEIEKYKLNNGAYYPMPYLAIYKGKTISHIVLVERDKEGALHTKTIYNDEVFEVTDEGYLYYSSYDCGVMQYDETIGKYVKYYHYCRTEHDYIGFLEIVLEEEEE